jgi:hypothetical protein
MHITYYIVNSTLDQNEKLSNNKIFYYSVLKNIIDSRINFLILHTCIITNTLVAFSSSKSSKIFQLNEAIQLSN